MNQTKFQHESFACDVDVFYRGDDLVVRFYHKYKEQGANDIRDMVVVDPGFGFICLKVVGDEGLLSGYLDQNVFSEDSVLKAIDFVLTLSPRSGDAYIPYHVRLFGSSRIIEYNGEY